MATPHIPDDILFEIFSCLSCQDLASVSLADRRLHCISQPLLYTEPKLEDFRFSTLQAFVRTLLTTGCEPLANHVRHLTISWKGSQLVPGKRDYGLFNIAAKRFGIDDWPLTGDIHIMLLLHLLPSLETLHLHPIGHTSWLRTLSDRHSDSPSQSPLPPGLRLLREFRSDFPNLVRPAGLAFLLALPHLRSLAVSIFGDIRVLRSSAIPTPGSSSVTSLELSYASLPHDALTPILEIPRELIHFYYRGTRSASLLGFGRALAPLRESLQTLVLDFSVMAAYRARGRVGDETRLSLRHWPALRVVAVSLVVLLGIPAGLAELADVLPPGIAVVRLLKDRCWTAEKAAMALVVLMGRKEMVPGLQSVGVWEEVHGEVKDELTGVCAEAGVQILDSGADLGSVFPMTAGVVAAAVGVVVPRAPGVGDGVCAGIPSSG